MGGRGRKGDPLAIMFEKWTFYDFIQAQKHITVSIQVGLQVIP